LPRVNPVRLRAGVAALAVAVSSVAPVVAAPTAACAQGAPRAVLVVDTSSQILRYCVTLDDESVTGIELITLASRQYGLSYRLGFGGAAVCMLAGTGTTGDDCFEEHPDFWGYWRGSNSGGWTWSSTGAASTTVSNGDVEGWSWGSGNDGSTHPAPPSTRFAAVCTQAEPSQDDNEDKTKEKNRSSRHASSAPTPAATSAPEEIEDEGDLEGRVAKPHRTRPKARDKARRDPNRVANASNVVTYTQPDPSPSARPIGASPRSGSGPPAAGLAGLVAAALLAASGIALRRRAHPPSAGGSRGEP
jgi:hypothetical protein